MRTTALLLSAVLAALLVTESLSAPHCGDAVIKASKQSKSTKSQADSADCSSEEIQASTGSGDYSKKSSKSSTSSKSASSDESSESYQFYKGGSPPCDDSLPPRKSGESDVDYYKRIFVVNTNCKQSIKTFYAKVFKQYKGEFDADFVKRIDVIFTKVYPSLDCRTNDDYIQYLEKYYIIKYSKLDNECDEDFFKRVLTRKCSESDETYSDRVVILKKYIKKVDWSKIKVDLKSKTGYIIIKGKSTSTSTGKSIDDSGSSSYTVITVEQAKKEYIRKEKEETITYYKRIITKTSTSKNIEEYVKRTTVIRKAYPCLDLWYNVKYIDLVKEYYINLYGQKSGEKIDKYCVRLFTKEEFETSEQYALRIEIIRNLFPNLSLWSDITYYEKYTKPVYYIVYKIKEKEVEVEYFKRITSRTVSETDVIFCGRVTLIRKTFPSLSVWYSEKTFTIVKEFYTVTYNRQSSEKDEVYYKRIAFKLDFETDIQRAQRVALVRLCYPNLDLWTSEKYYTTYTKSIYTIVYKKESYEDDLTYFKRILIRTDKETNAVFVGRVYLIQKTYSSLTVWYDSKYLAVIKEYYTLKYTRGPKECNDDYIKRLTIKEQFDTSDIIYAKRLYAIHYCTATATVWYDETLYEKYTKVYYTTYYKKGSNEICSDWLKKIITKLPCESDENAIKRIILINKSQCGCSCWTADNFSKIECDKSFSSEYITKIKKTFIKQASSVSIKKSSSKTSSNSASASQDSSEVSIKNDC